jgi:hypothetical protein
VSLCESTQLSHLVLSWKDSRFAPEHFEHRVTHSPLDIHLRKISAGLRLLPLAPDFSVY